MESRSFAAYALAGELELNRLATFLSIPRKFRWEEPLILNPVTLKPVSPERGEAHQVYLYSFGAAVFLDVDDRMRAEFLERLKGAGEPFREGSSVRFQDSYALRVGGNGELTVTNDHAIVPAFDPVFIDIIAFVIAKSVALERIEDKVDLVLDEMEGLIALLDRGKLGIPDRRLAKLASSILNFKYRSIAYIMILDKPDVTWENPVADRLYLTMANLFELSQRYQEIKHKSETLLDITEVFSSLSHARRATRLEWTIIVLIFIEIVIYLVEIAR